MSSTFCGLCAMGESKALHNCSLHQEEYDDVLPCGCIIGACRCDEDHSGLEEGTFQCDLCNEYKPPSEKHHNGSDPDEVSPCGTPETLWWCDDCHFKMKR